MISPRTALRRVLGCCAPLPAQWCATVESPGRVLAEDVRAAIALQPFDNSQMDGYAVRARDCAGASPRRPVHLRVAGTVHAGGRAARMLRAGQAVAVATGAPLPRGADAVLPVEEVTVHGRELRVTAAPAPGRYVRRRGEDVRPGGRVMTRGSVIHAGGVGALAALGRTRIRVVRPPRVGVITTGDEVIAPGRRLSPGRVYDSSLVMLEALLRQEGLAPAVMRHVRDDARMITQAIRGALAQCDVVITVGGVSVGPRDFVRGAFTRLGVQQVFHGVRQQPGKPLYFGTRGRRLVFGLPGNPASSYVCFCYYVLPALHALAGREAVPAPLERRPLANAVVADEHRWRLLRARVVPGNPGRIEVLPGQGSHRVTPFAIATHLVVLPPAARGRRVAAGTLVDCVPLPHAGTK